MQERLFDGSTYLAERDEARLRPQLERVYAIMEDHRWHGLRELAIRSNASEASASARLRDLRKPKHGGHNIKREYIGGGFHAYRLVPPVKPARGL